MVEILDVVTEKNEVIGGADMRTVHEQKLLHRSATVLVFKDETFSELLLQKRSKHVINNPGKWCTPGGHVQSGETTMDTARREFCEEMLSKDDDNSLQPVELFTMRKDADADPEFISVFRLIYAGVISPDAQEVEDWQFMQLHEVYKKIDDDPDFFNETTKVVMLAYQQFARRKKRK